MTRDGVQLAYSRMGCGALLRQDRKLDDASRIRLLRVPVWRHLYRELSHDRTADTL